jgi:hypothetical protein
MPDDDILRDAIAAASDGDRVPRVSVGPRAGDDVRVAASAAATAAQLTLAPHELVEYDEATARHAAVAVITRDFAYASEYVPRAVAEPLVARFLALVPPPRRFFSNGSCLREPLVDVDGVVHKGRWNPATPATFDMGVIVVGEARCAVLWFEDED